MILCWYPPKKFPPKKFPAIKFPKMTTQDKKFPAKKFPPQKFPAVKFPKSTHGPKSFRPKSFQNIMMDKFYFIDKLMIQRLLVYSLMLIVYQSVLLREHLSILLVSLSPVKTRGYRVELIRLSVCPSVRLSVCPA